MLKGLKIPLPLIYLHNQISFLTVVWYRCLLVSGSMPSPLQGPVRKSFAGTVKGLHLFLDKELDGVMEKLSFVSRGTSG